jgi:hypothetical protein
MCAAGNKCVNYRKMMSEPRSRASRHEAHFCS